MGALSASGLIGSIATAATALKTVDSAFQTLSGSAARQQRDNVGAQQNLALQQLQAQQGLNEANAAQDAALSRQKITTDAAAAENTRMTALRRAVARQNAQFGAQGVSADDDGSSEAVLLGLTRQSDDDKTQQDALDTLRYTAVDQNLDQQQSVDVLQQGQLQQRQNLQRIIDGY